MKTYVAERTAHGNVVNVDGLPLPPCAEHSGAVVKLFDWGNAGQGARYMTEALLEDALESNHLSQELWNEYLLAVVANLPNSGWTLTQGDVWAWALSHLLSRFSKLVSRGPSCIVV